MAVHTNVRKSNSVFELTLMLMKKGLAGLARLSSRVRENKLVRSAESQR